MSNIHGLFSGKGKKEEEKNTTAYNGNGVASESPDARGFDDLINKAKQNPSDGKPSKGGSTDVRLTIYNNGLLVEAGDDKEFKDFTDEKNKAYLETIKQQRIPDELAKKYGRDLSCTLDDRRPKDYQKPPPPYNPWAGQAASIGGGQQA